jgi:mannose-6-phosphate isomerase-like protein (cupin superfamily)
MALQIVETDGMGTFSPAGAAPVPLLDVGKVRTLLLNLEAGQALAPCKMSLTVLYYIIEGQGAIRVMDEQARLQTGSLTIVPPGAIRSISADIRMRVLAVQVP